MKKLLIVLLATLFLALPLAVSGAEVTETLIFEWRMEDITNLTEWRLFWSDTSGGPYIEVATIPYDPEVPGPVYSSAETPPAVTGDQGTTVTKYFVLVSCGDIPQQDGTSEYLCSGDSNEVSHGFWIPAGMFSVPLEFKIRAN